MKKKITILTIMVVLLLATALPAFAANGNRPENGCQPGANNGIVEEWQLFGFEEYVEFLVEEFGRDPVIALEHATATYNFCDHNKDGSVCVMEQNLPTDNNGSSNWLLIEDNHPFGGKK